MKANRKFINEEEAVSPVIAVILMVAITVVLAATVFVLVNDLGKNVGSSGPALGLVSDAAGSSTSQWTIKLSSATKLADVNDYKFIFNTPAHGTSVFTPDATAAEYSAGYCQYVLRADATDNGRKDGSEATAVDCSSAAGALAAADNGYQIKWTDIDGNNKFSVGDTVVIQYSSNGDSTAFDSTFSAGEYQLEILHTPSGSSAGSLPRTF